MGARRGTARKGTLLTGARLARRRGKLLNIAVAWAA